MLKLFNENYRGHNNLENVKKIELFKKLVSEIDIAKYEQKEYEKIINLIYQDIFRVNDG